MICVIGDLIIDEYWMGDATRISPEAPVPVVSNIKKDIRVGGAAGVALNLHSMGCDTTLISQVDTTFDKAQLGSLPHILYTCNKTPTKARIIAMDQVVCRLDDEEYQPYDLVTSLMPATTQLLVLSDYAKGMLANSRKIITDANKQGIKVIVDPKIAWTNYQGAWLLKANEKELRDQIGWKVSDDQLPDTCSKLCSTYKLTNLIITLGKRGMFLHTPKIDVMLPTATIHNVVDVTGAGDVVLASIAYYVNQGKDLVSACKLANKLAGISVGYRGTHITTKDDLSKAEGKIVFTNGCFDILHKGHIEYLKASAQLGSKLVVGINSDDSVKRLKGPNRPINSAEDRKHLLESLEFVDEVIIFHEDTPLELIKLVKPDIITKGGDYTVDQVVGNGLVSQVIIIPLTTGYSTTNTLEKLNGS